MLKNHSITILYALIIYVFADNCNTIISTNVNLAQCNFYFLQNNGQCSTSRFVQCKIRSCVKTSSSYVCQSYNTYNQKNISECMKKCCGNNVIQSPYDSALSCSASKSMSKQTPADTNKILLIIISIFGGLTILMIIGFCLYKKLGLSNQIETLNQLTNPEVDQRNMNKKQLSDQVSMRNIISNYKWQIVQFDIKQMPNCTICLCELPNVILQCGHFFHQNCLRMWFKKKFQCGVCRRYNLFSFKILCRVCYRNQTRLSLSQFGRLKIQKGLICYDCKPI